jgi:hypothetical protein
MGCAHGFNILKAPITTIEQAELRHGMLLRPMLNLPIPISICYAQQIAHEKKGQH